MNITDIKLPIARSQLFMAMRFHVVTPFSNVVGYNRPEDGGNKVIRNAGILPCHYTASQPTIPRLPTVFQILVYKSMLPR